MVGHIYYKCYISYNLFFILQLFAAMADTHIARTRLENFYYLNISVK